jgi:FkbM family methyltransferase
VASTSLLWKFLEGSFEVILQSLIRSLPFGRYMAAKLLSAFVPGGVIRSSLYGRTVRLNIREIIQRDMFLGKYEPTQSEWMRSCLHSGDTFVDVGASFGNYTLLASKIVGKTGRVYSFEPSPIAFSALSSAFGPQDSGSVFLINAAAGAAKGHATLYLPNTTEIHSPSIMPSDTAFKPLQIEVHKLDDCLANAGTIRLLKMDVEGYEPNVVEGMAQLLSAGKVRNIFCEFNSGWLIRNNSTPQELFDKFISYGFKLKKSTELQVGLKGRLENEFYSLQDMWFSLDF